MTEIFILHRRDGDNEDHFMIIEESNEECARAAASCHDVLVDLDGVEYRNYRWLAKETTCEKISPIGEPRVLFHKEGDVEFNYLKGKLA